MIQARINYGPIKSGHEYRILNKGYDYYLVSCTGKPVCVPFYIFEGDMNVENIYDN